MKSIAQDVVPPLFWSRTASGQPGQKGAGGKAEQNDSDAS
jgi:hypothetical protein